MTLARTSRPLGLLCFVALLASCSSDKRNAFMQSDSAIEAAPDAAAPPLPVVPPGSVIPPLPPDAGTGANGLPPDFVPPATELDASTQAPMDASTQAPLFDARQAPQPLLDGTLASACALDAASSACCSEDPAKCAHPLRGGYAVRTVSYARQKTSVSGVEVDVVNKAVMLSVANISGTGVVTEHLCAIELINEDGLYSWTSPTATERIGDSVAPLELRDGVFVRPLASDRVYVAWSQAKQPADCTPGAKHASGCTCAENDALPTKPDDCRVSDLDEDGLPGLRLSVGLERPTDLNAGAAFFSVQVAAIKSVEWRIQAGAMDPLVGQIAGSIEQSQLSIAGEGAADIGQIRNANCPDALGHVELVRGAFDCAMLLAGRTGDPEGLDLFDVALDGQPPLVDACPDPDPACAVDTDGDGTADCRDACAQDRSKTAAGACGCGVAETNSDGDALPDCTDACPADASKVAAGSCGCGVADTNTDGDAQSDCTDACPADASKVAAGSCGCGVADTNTDGDAQPDCSDGCPADPGKIAAGSCGCGVADVDSDSDATVDCLDACPADASKTAAGTCGCGVADRDLNGDGSVDCTDLCPADPAKVAPGACGCGVADTNTDGDALPDCTDACDSDPAKTVAGQCGCGVAETDADGDGSPNCVDLCPSDPTRTQPGSCGCQDCAANPLVGTFAARSSMYAKQRIGTDPATTSKAYSYALVTIASNTDGSLTLSERGCWSQTVPNPSEGGLAVYSWVKPAWSAAFPPTLRTLRPSAGGTFSGGVVNHSVGWDAARQPAACTATATPPAGWTSSWGSTCRCNADAASLPPYDRDAAPYDCRLTDPDADGFPGASSYVSTSAPATPNSDASGLLGARAFAASLVTDRWTLTPSTGPRQWGTIADTSTSAIVGCTGGACSALGATSPSGGVCPEALNKVQLVPVTAGSDTCDEIIAQRESLFVTTEDGPWPSASACPVP